MSKKVLRTGKKEMTEEKLIVGIIILVIGVIALIACFPLGIILIIVGLIVLIIGIESESRQVPVQPPYYPPQPYQQMPYPLYQTPTYPGYHLTNHRCRECNSQLWWSDQFQSYYCSQCMKYIPASQDSIDKAISGIKRELDK